MGNSGNNLLIGFLVFSVLFFAVALLVGPDDAVDSDVDAADSLATSARGDPLTLESRQLRLVSTRIVWLHPLKAQRAGTLSPSRVGSCGSCRRCGRRSPTRQDSRGSPSIWSTRLSDAWGSAPKRSSSTRPSLLPHC